MYNKDSDSLNAGAPDIRLSGNQQMASYGYDDAMSESRQAYDQGIEDGTIPFDMTFEEFLDLMQGSKQAPSAEGIMASAPTGTYTQQRKQMMAGGGIAGLEKRQGYFLGDLVDKIKDDLIPNELKENPLLTAAIVGGGINQFGLQILVPDFIAEGSNVGQNWLGDLLGTVTPGDTQFNTVFGDDIGFTGGITPGKFPMTMPGGYELPESIRNLPSATLNKVLEFAGVNRNVGSGLTGMFSSALSPYLGEGTSGRVNPPLYPLGIGAAVGKYVEGLPKDELPMDTTSIDPAAIAEAARGTDAEGAAAGLRFLPEQVTRAAEGGRIGYAGGGGKPHTSKEGKEAVIARYRQAAKKFKDMYGSDWRAKREEFADEGISSADFLYGNYAQGGRIGAQEGGLMDLGGMEKDYRQEGGFVPIGGKEKADDVPARLSKNEFVFTADAVRAAGGGDIDEGAAVMERLMENLEAGGKVSEDSQGLEGARGMFANAQQLEKRII